MSTLKGLQTDHSADFRLIITGLCDLIDSTTAKKKDHTPKIGMKFSCQFIDERSSTRLPPLDSPQKIVVTLMEFKSLDS